LVMTFVYYFEPKMGNFSPVANAFYNFLPFILGIYISHKIPDLKKFFSQKLSFLRFAALLAWMIIFSESIIMFARSGKDIYLREQWRISVTVYGLAVGGILYKF